MTIDHLLLNFNGVLAPALDERLFEAIASFEGEPTDPLVRRWVRDSCLKYYAGALESNALIEKILDISKLRISVETFTGVLHKQVPIDQDVLEVLKVAQARLKLTFFSEFPRQWIQTDWGEQGFLADTGMEPILFFEDFPVSGAPTPWLEKVTKQLAIPQEKILLVDRRNSVTSYAVRKGVNAILFVNAFRLGQELSLRQLI